MTPSWLPAELAARIDSGELADLPREAEARRAALEARLDAHVVAYRSEATPARDRAQLCQLLEPASLSKAQLDGLRAAEERGIVLVAYAKPARLRTVLTQSGGER